MMRIVYFANRFAFEYSVELANHALKRSEIGEVYLFLPKGFVSETQLAQLDERVVFDYFELPGNKKPWAMWRSFAKLTNKIKKINPDLIHVQGSAHPYFWLHYRKLKHIPLVDTIHDAEPHPGFGSFMQTYMRKKGIQHAKRWFIHGESLKELFLKLNPTVKAQQVIVVPKGHYGIFAKYTDREIETDRNTLLFFGNITKYKGIDVLIEASKTIIEAHPEVRFLIAGKIRDKDKEEIDFSALEGDPHFELKTYRLSDQEVAEAYLEAGLIVMPYKEASQSGVLSIAFGMGKAVIASEVGALPEIIEHDKNGLLVKPGDSAALAEAVISLLKDPKKAKTFETASKRYAEEHLSWDEVLEKCTMAYKELI